MIKNILNLMKTKKGKAIISIILGIGVASMFRNVCKNKDCLIFKMPPLKNIKDNIYKYDNKCYKYIEQNIPCGSLKRQIL